MRPAEPRGPAAKAAAAREAWLSQFICLGLIIVIATPLALGFLGSAGRIVFPLVAFVIAGVMLFAGRTSQFVVFVLWLFVLSPFIRRVLDFHVGWQEPNPLLLAPYSAALWSLFALPGLLVGRDVPYRPFFVVILLTVCYGLLLAFANNQLVSGCLNWLVWFIPPVFAVLILNSDESAAVIREHLETFFLLGIFITGAYGIYQFYFVPPWDAFWMLNAEMGSIGVPIPFEIRVFSTMNSPGPLAFFLVAGLHVVVARGGTLAMIALALGTVALGLSMVRAAWVGFALGIVFLFVLGNQTNRLRIGLSVAAVCLAGLGLSAVPDVGEVLVERIASFSNVGNDTSALERWRNYAMLGSIANENLFGQGLAASANFTEASGENRAIDSGLIETILALGVPMGTLYLLAIGAMLLGSIVASGSAAAARGATAAATAVGLGIMGGSVTVGVVGVLFFVCLVQSIILSRVAEQPPA